MIFVLIGILVLFVLLFVVFLVRNIKMDGETFNKLCQKKVAKIAKRNKLYAISNLNICNYNREKLGINHVIFGTKYIYLITDFMLKGFVSGEVDDNSWVYFNNLNRKTHYLSNLNIISNKNTQEFAGILGIKEDLIASICLVPNECDFKIEGLENDHNHVVHFSSLARKIKKYEKQNIDLLDRNQTYEQYKEIEKRNNERI